MKATRISGPDGSSYCCNSITFNCGQGVLRLLLCVIFLLGILTTTLRAEDFSVEYAVKSALLLNFARFTDWPADSPLHNSDRILITILGSDPFATTINETLKGKTAKGKPVSILRVRSLKDLPVDKAHIVFLSPDSTDQLLQWANLLSTSQSLVVAEHPAASESKVDVQFLVNEVAQVRFRLNLLQIRQKGLSLRSAMQKAAVPWTP